MSEYMEWAKNVARSGAIGVLTLNAYNYYIIFDIEVQIYVAIVCFFRPNRSWTFFRNEMMNHIEWNITKNPLKWIQTAVLI